MYRTRRTAPAALVITALLAWSTSVDADVARAEIRPHIDTAAHVEKMQGHLIASLENAKRGNMPLAQAHAAHPLHEHYQQLPDRLATEHLDLDKALREALTRLPQNLTGTPDAKAYGAQVESARQLLERVSATLIPEDVRQSPAFQAGVLEHLLEEIAEEYEEAVRDGKVVNLAEYQDAYGFLQRARVWMEPLATRLQEADRQQARRLWKMLDDAMPAVMPPTTPVRADAVAGHAEALVKLLTGH